MYGSETYKHKAFSQFAQLRRRDQEETEQYVSHIDRKTKELWEAMTTPHSSASKSTSDTNLGDELDSYIDKFLSKSERESVGKIPKSARDSAYLKICSGNDPLSREESLIHKYYVRN